MHLFIFCRAQGTRFSILQELTMKKNVKMNVCMCMYDRSMLYTRNQHYASINKQTSKRSERMGISEGGDLAALHSCERPPLASQGKHFPGRLTTKTRADTMHQMSKCLILDFISHNSPMERKDPTLCFRTRKLRQRQGAACQGPATSGQWHQT